ncbi:MAG: hypothetical protein JWL82_437 [Parcubacteria group bacterium]|nr:hypothetical protein [Parcubacteria group bacterium]
MVLGYLTHHASPCGEFLNPKISCNPSQEQIVFSRDLRKKVDAKVREVQATDRAQTVAVYFQMLNKDQWFSVNASQLYQPASIAKVPLMMWFIGLAETDPSILDQSLDYKEGSVKLTPHFDYGGIEHGKTYSVSDLIESMIVNSDNNAAYALASRLTPEQQTSMFADFDFRAPRGTSTEYRNDVKTIAASYRLLYDATYLTPEDSEKALELLSRTKFNAGLNAGIPDDVRAAHKFGERETTSGAWQIHDCGIIYAKNNPYILCVMTRGKDPDVLAGVIADISKLVYTEVTT